MIHQPQSSWERLKRSQQALLRNTRRASETRGRDAGSPRTCAEQHVARRRVPSHDANSLGMSFQHHHRLCQGQREPVLRNLPHLGREKERGSAKGRPCRKACDPFALPQHKAELSPLDINRKREMGRESFLDTNKPLGHLHVTSFQQITTSYLHRNERIITVSRGPFVSGAA